MAAQEAQSSTEQERVGVNLVELCVRRNYEVLSVKEVKGRNVFRIPRRARPQAHTSQLSPELASLPSGSTMEGRRVGSTGHPSRPGLSRSGTSSSSLSIHPQAHAEKTDMGEIHPGLYALRELRDLLDSHKARDMDLFNSHMDTK